MHFLWALSGMRSCNKHDLEILAHIDAHISLMEWHFCARMCVLTVKVMKHLCWTFIIDRRSDSFFFSFLGRCYFWSNYSKQDPKVQQYKCILKRASLIHSLKLVRIEFWFKLMIRTTQTQLTHSPFFFEIKLKSQRKFIEWMMINETIDRSDLVFAIYHLSIFHQLHQFNVRAANHWTIQSRFAFIAVNDIFCAL